VDRVTLTPAAEARDGRARVAARRTLWRWLGLVLAATIAWLLVVAYRQPEFVLDLANLRLC